MPARRRSPGQQDRHAYAVEASPRRGARTPLTDERTQRLLTIPGIGALNATALVAAVGDPRVFGRGTDLAAWLRLVPRQAMTGGKQRLLGIAKRGGRYLRKNLIHGARALLPTMGKSDPRLGA